jgi:hypothetical protein
MGTRSTVKFIDYEQCVCSIYQQYDGYPDGVGLTLAEFLAKLEIVNGYGLNPVNQANGISCLAAQYVAQEKKGVGGLYMTHSADIQEYNYIVSLAHDELHITVHDSEAKELFKGSMKQFLNFCKRR